MGIIRQPKPVKLFIAILYPEREILEKVKPLLEEHFGKIEWESPHLPFIHTNYYRNIGEQLTQIGRASCRERV